MKYLLNERQYNVIIESKIPLSIIRRANKNTLEKFVSLSRKNNPPYCDEHNDGYDYADAVIDDAIDYFYTEVCPKMEEIDDYSEITDYLRRVCRNLFGEILVYYFEDNCIKDEN